MYESDGNKLIIFGLNCTFTMK